MKMQWKIGTVLYADGIGSEGFWRMESTLYSSYLIDASVHTKYLALVEMTEINLKMENN